MPPRVREAIRIVERDGWYHVRTTGSHRHYHHPEKPGTVTIAGNPGKELEIKIWHTILEQAGLDRRDYR